MTRRRQWVLFSLELAAIVLWIALGWPWWALVALLIAPPVVLTVADYIQIAMQMSWIVPFTELLTIIKSPETDTVREDLLDEYAKGSRNPTTLIALSAAYEYIGDGESALRYADEVYTLEDGDHLCREHSIRSRLQGDALTITRFDALMTLGRFSEAAQVMRDRRALSMQRNFMTVLAAWAYFLADDETNARAMLAAAGPPGPRYRLSQSISPRYKLLVAYMRHTYKLEDARANVVEHYPEIIGWEDTARRNANNPYGKRLRTVLDDLHAMLGAQ